VRCDGVIYPTGLTFTYTPEPGPTPPSEGQVILHQKELWFLNDNLHSPACVTLLCVALAQERITVTGLSVSWQSYPGTDNYFSTLVQPLAVVRDSAPTHCVETELVSWKRTSRFFLLFQLCSLIIKFVILLCIETFLCFFEPSRTNGAVGAHVSYNAALGIPSNLLIVDYNISEQGCGSLWSHSKNYLPVDANDQSVNLIKKTLVLLVWRHKGVHLHLLFQEKSASINRCVTLATWYVQNPEPQINSTLNNAWHLLWCHWPIYTKVMVGEKTAMSYSWNTVKSRTN